MDNLRSANEKEKTERMSYGIPVPIKFHEKISFRIEKERKKRK